MMCERKPHVHWNGSAGLEMALFGPTRDLSDLRLLNKLQASMFELGCTSAAPTHSWGGWILLLAKSGENTLLNV